MAVQRNVLHLLIRDFPYSCGSRISLWGCRPLMRALFGSNTWENERIRSCWGWGLPVASPGSANALGWCSNTWLPFFSRKMQHKFGLINKSYIWTHQRVDSFVLTYILDKKQNRTNPPCCRWLPPYPESLYSTMRILRSQLHSAIAIAKKTSVLFLSTELFTCSDVKDKEKSLS